MRTSSAKAKGRRLQQLVRDSFRNLFKKELEQDDINCTLMGESGIDIKFSPAAKKLIQIDIECKNQEKLNIHAALKQAETNAGKDRIPAVVFSKNRSKVYIAMEFEKLLLLLYPERIQTLLNEGIDPVPDEIEPQKPMNIEN